MRVEAICGGRQRSRGAAVPRSHEDQQQRRFICSEGAHGAVQRYQPSPTQRRGSQLRLLVPREHRPLAAGARQSFRAKVLAGIEHGSEHQRAQEPRVHRGSCRRRHGPNEHQPPAADLVPLPCAGDIDRVPARHAAHLLRQHPTSRRSGYDRGYAAESGDGADAMQDPVHPEEEWREGRGRRGRHGDREHEDGG